LEERDFLKDLGVDGNNIRHCIFNKWARRLWAVIVWLRLEASGGSFFKHGDEKSGLQSAGNFLTS
jgi:hypothetical protein